jgi:hypothetical protein
VQRVLRPHVAPRPRWLWVFIGLVGVVCLLLPYLSLKSLWGARTLRYELTPTEVVIRFGPERIAIPRTSIQKVTILTPTRGVRLFGTGLPDLQEGRWRFAETGPITLYSRSTSPLTVLETPEGKWGISPADPEAFKNALTAGQTGVFLPPAPSSISWPSLLALGLAGTLIPIGVGGLLLYLIRVPERMAYVLTDRELEIHIGWKRIPIPYSAIRDVRVISGPGMPWRIFGAALPGLYWGRFRWKAAGQSLDLYATRYKPLVVLSLDQRTIGISPADTDGFLAELNGRRGA